MDTWVAQLTGSMPMGALPCAGRVHLMDDRDPWDLLPSHIEVLDALSQEYTAYFVAVRLGRSVKTVEEQLRQARERMGACNSMHAVLMWDRYQRSKGSK